LDRLDILPGMQGAVLILDSGSPLVSVAVGREGVVLAMRAREIARSSALLLAMVDEVLREAGLDVGELAGIAALGGPGSFTGLRIGLATVLGLHQALGIAATTLPTLRVLAALATPDGGRAVGAVDSLRGEWAVEEWSEDVAQGMALVPGPELAGLAPCTLVGFGISRLGELPGWPARPGGIRLVEPGPLAPAALSLLARLPAESWDPALLSAPIYARPPAVTAPRPFAARPVAAKRAGR
jgi:tRNA threonylcarbamoyladenosine biosynthesis protein TsaB